MLHLVGCNLELYYDARTYEYQIGICHASSVGCLLTTLANSQQNWHEKSLLHVYSVEILLVMDSGLVRNMYSTLSNKFEK
jgi:hypothetical protein